MNRVRADVKREQDNMKREIMWGEREMWRKGDDVRDNLKRKSCLSKERQCAER